MQRTDDFIHMPLATLTETRQKCLCYKSSLIHLSDLPQPLKTELTYSFKLLQSSPKHKAMKLVRSSHPKCSLKRKIQRKIPVPEPLFLNKVADVSAATLLKRGSGTGVFL